MKFKADFDRAGITLSIASLLILLYFSIANPLFVQTYIVAFAFWITGFLGSMFFGFTQRSQLFNMKKLISIGMFTGLIIVAFAGVNYAYASLSEQEIVIAEKLASFAVGISEELFFGVFLLGLFINWLGLHPYLAIGISALVHAVYHVPNWGANIPLIMLFFTCFVIARSVYVFVYPKVGMLLGAHGFWNLGVS